MGRDLHDERHYRHLGTTVHNADLKDSRVSGGGRRGAERLTLDCEAAGIDGRVRVRGLHREHKVSIHRAGCRELTRQKHVTLQNKHVRHVVVFGGNAEPSSASHAPLTIEPVVAGGFLGVVTASQFVAGVTRDASGAAVQSQSSFRITISR